MGLFLLFATAALLFAKYLRPGLSIPQDYQVLTTFVFLIGWIALDTYLQSRWERQKRQEIERVTLADRHK
ncbi:MAG: hypothetical protein EON96_00860 [Caulobacteraceae bacterium]|nr:MAG: hypothetical protein EON96_00860 [Caulobacteraceae bacterium]